MQLTGTCTFVVTLLASGIIKSHHHFTVDPGGDRKNCSNTGSSHDADNATGNFLGDTFAAFLQPCALQLQSLDLRQLAKATRRACRKD